MEYKTKEQMKQERIKKLVPSLFGLGIAYFFTYNVIVALLDSGVLSDDSSAIIKLFGFLLPFAVTILIYLMFKYEREGIV